jgi:hypothetical protein
VEDRCRRIEPCLEEKIGGIEDRGIGDSRSASSSHFKLANSEIPISGEGHGHVGREGHILKELV